MNLEYPYWYFQSAIPPRICDDIIKYGLAQKEQIGITGEVEDAENPTEEELKNLKALIDKRRSKWRDKRSAFGSRHMTMR